MRIRWLETDAPGDDLTTVARLWNRHHTEVGIDVSPCTTDEVEARLAHGWDGEPERIGLVLDDSATPDAVVTAFMPQRENTGMAIVGCLAGTGRGRVHLMQEALRHLVALAHAAGRDQVLAESWDFLPAHGGVLRGLGFVAAHHQVLYEKSPLGPVRLRPADDLVLIEHHAGPSPDELLLELGVVADAIEDAPTGDVAFDSVDHTGDRLRAWEVGQLRGGQRVHRTIARDRSTGRLVGHSVVTVAAAHDRLAVQHDTAVLAAYRGAGIGARLKAAMLAALVASEPHVSTIQTWNAAENTPIRRLNARMGFAERASVTAWELSR
ncbi:hypothetical protein GCM10023339_76190 [Alloalcanivorax gelatiniphagus]